MKILLIGNTGQVGYEIEKEVSDFKSDTLLPKLISLDYPEIDLSSRDSIVTTLRTHTPRLVFNAAAYTAVDKAESEPDLAMAINGTAPGIIAEELKKSGGAFVHYSTDYVFDGTKDAPYTEDDSPNPLSTYGRSKLAGEEAVRSSGIPHLILRSSWIYGTRGSNFLRTILRLAREKEELNIVNDQLGAPTWSRTVAEKTIEILRRVSDFKSDTLFSEHSGLYHLTATGSTSWYGFARAILDLDPREEEHTLRTLTPIPTSDYPTPAQRPASSRLDCTRAREMFNLDLPAWDEDLREVMQEME